MSFLNKKVISFSDDNVVGLDIGSTSIKAVCLEDKIIKSYSFEAIPEGVITNGNIVNEKMLTEKIKKIVKNAKPDRIKTKKARFSISESKSFLRLISIPEMNQEEIEETVKWEIEANIPLPVEQVYYDWKKIEDVFPDNGKVKILVLATAKKVVDQLLNIVDNAGLETVGVESESTSLVRSLLNKKNDNKTVLIVDLGRNKTTFVFAVKGVPCFTSSIPVSEQMMIGQIAKAFNISDEKARKIEEQNGMGTFFEDKYLFSSISPVLENLVSEIEKTINFYLDGLRYSSSVDKIIVCGKLSGEKNIVTYLSKKLKKEIEVGDILAGLNSDRKIVPIIEKGVALQYATAIGLALGCKK